MIVANHIGTNDHSGEGSEGGQAEGRTRKVETGQGEGERGSSRRRHWSRTLWHRRAKIAAIPEVEKELAETKAKLRSLSCVITHNSLHKGRGHRGRDTDATRTRHSINLNNGQSRASPARARHSIDLNNVNTQNVPSIYSEERHWRNQRTSLPSLPLRYPSSTLVMTLRGFRSDPRTLALSAPLLSRAPCDTL